MTRAAKSDWLQDTLTKAPVAKVRGAEQAQPMLRAISAKYDARKKIVTVALHNGASFSFPAALAQGLSNATSPQLSCIEISPLGTGLCWPLLDVDLTVAGLLNGVFGSRAWMQAHAARAGQVRSAAKTQAARRNGALGGRPRKQVQPSVKV